VLGKDRLITAGWMLPLLAAAVIYLPPLGMAAVFGLVATIGQWELYRFHFKGGLPAFAWAGCLAGFMVVVGMQSATPLLAPVCGVILVLILRLGSDRDMADALGEAAVVVLGLLYVAVLLGHLGLLHQLEEGARWLFFLMLVTWSGDAAAYYVGSTMGRRKLTLVSPNKTVEGTLGGIGASIGAAYLGMTFTSGLCWWDPLWIGLLLGVCALLGDLTESLFKRGASVKDSSDLIPGHGGILDKVDAFLYTGPALYYYLTFVVRAA